MMSHDANSTSPCKVCKQALKLRLSYLSHLCSLAGKWLQTWTLGNGGKYPRIPCARPAGFPLDSSSQAVKTGPLPLGLAAVL
jgi:hypothetical protein